MLYYRVKTLGSGDYIFPLFPSRMLLELHIALFYTDDPDLIWPLEVSVHESSDTTDRYDRDGFESTANNERYLFLHETKRGFSIRRSVFRNWEAQLDEAL